MRSARRQLALVTAVLLPVMAWAVELSGDPVQGGMMIGRTSPGASAWLDQEPLPVSSGGVFAFGFGRDATGARTLRIRQPDGTEETETLTIRSRQFDVQRIDGLPEQQVTPPAEVLARIREDAARVSQARARRDDRTDFLAGFTWPARGPISGVYGSQRILNGEPRRPHFGVDVAAPEGAPVVAPAPGVVTLSDPDQYFSGGTVIIDHGLGVSSSFLHLSAVDVQVGDRVTQGQLIGRVGATGRATGPHLDWRMNVLGERIDPALLVEGEPETAGDEAE